MDQFTGTRSVPGLDDGPDETLIIDEGLEGTATSGSIDSLSASGAELDPADAGGQLTRAGRSLAKHSDLFPSVSGGPAALNEAGQNALDEILTNPDTIDGMMENGNFAGGKIFIAPY